jgi:hypothetical protein
MSRGELKREREGGLEEAGQCITATQDTVSLKGALRRTFGALVMGDDENQMVFIRDTVDTRITHSLLGINQVQ